MPTRNRKAVKRKKKTVRPKKVTVSVTRKTTIGKVRSAPKSSSHYMKVARDKLYNEMGALMIQKEKAKTKRAKKKIAKKISLKRSQINKLK